MKIIHHTSKETYERHALNYRESHFLDLPDGSVIVVGTIEPTYREALEAEADTTPFPFLLSNEALPAKIVMATAHLGVSEGDSTMTASLKIAKTHRAFHPSQF
jgi:hypothetical protein